MITPETRDSPGEAVEDESEGDPMRRCAVTRARLPKRRMIRFVISPDRRVVPDLSARLPGRGIWLSAVGDVIETACTRGAFARVARGPVTVPPDLLPDLQDALVRRIGEQLGLARRAGQAVAGFTKAREWIETGRAALLVQAADGSVEERTRLRGGWPGPVVAPLTAAELGRVFGRERVVHIAVAAGKLAERIGAEAERLAGLRCGGAADRRNETPHGVAGRHEGRTQAGR